MFSLEKELGLVEIKKKCDESNSRIFGFIMYTRRHSYIVKAMRDVDFWNELDETSGANWPIFAVRPLAQGYYTCSGNCSPGVFGMMVQTWVEPNENRKYLDVFSLDESRDLPCFIAFIWNENDEIEQITCKLSNDSKDEALKSIREVVTIISETEQQIFDENKKTVNVFRNVRNDIKAHFTRKKLLKTLRYFPYIYDFVSHK